MKLTLEHALFSFLQTHWNPPKPLLIGLSGGPDSLALLHLALRCRKDLGISFGIAHVDHGWRDESSREAMELESLAKALELPFHLKSLDPKLLKGNLEAASRLERYRFFASICFQHGYQAVLVGHHADDQAETVLKRLLEGAHLSSLSGLREIYEVEGASIWRPLLHASKKDLVKWLKANNLSGYDDPTNRDSQYLRGRLRQTILPQLSAAFGKEIIRPLYQIGKEAQQLESYFDEKTKPLLSHLYSGIWGEYLDLSQTAAHPLEIDYLVRRLSKKHGFVLSRQCLEEIVQWVVAKSANRRVEVNEGTICIDRGVIFFVSAFRGSCKTQGSSIFGIILPDFPFLPGVYQWRNFSISISASSEVCQSTCWRRLWRGEGLASLPKGHYRFGKVDVGALMAGTRTRLDEWWTQCKVPAFLRHAFPVIWKDDCIAHEFLSGRSLFQNRDGEEGLLVSIEGHRRTEDSSQ